MKNKDEYTPEQIFELYQINELEQSTAANYLRLQKKWQTRNLKKLKEINQANSKRIWSRRIKLEAIEEAEELIEKIADYYDVIIGNWIREDDPTLQDRIQIHLKDVDIARFYKALKKCGIINSTASEFSGHFRNKKGEGLKTGFVNSLKGSNFSPNKLIEVIEKYSDNYDS